jgi:hypothetical protein
MLPKYPGVRAPGIPAKHTASKPKRNLSPAIPSGALWDGLLAAGGPAAALDLLERITAGQDWRQPPARPTATGSSWDTAAGPDAPLPQHLADWIEGSAIHPALAAANLQTLAGAEVLQALAGDRLERLGGWASQYATGAVAHLLRPLEPVAAAGGWWCSGLDPADNWAPMAWGCFRPDQPRWDQGRDRARKYEHPISAPARSFWLKVPAKVAQLVAERYRLQLPAEVAADRDGAAGAFWRWWALTPALPLVVTEGAKKAAALLSAGVPAVALPGIWNGAPKGADDRPELLADLAAVPWDGRLAMVLFDHSTRKDPAEPKAAGRLARLLLRAGARQALAGTVPGTYGKGADDHLAAGGTWEQLLEALKPLAPLPVLPRLRPAAIVAPAGSYLGAVAPIPPASEARLVAMAAPMGSGKTEAIAAAVAPLLEAGTRVVLLTHRRSLGAALADRLGLPWGDDALPGSDLRQQGLALCIDSLCSRSAVRFRPADWAGAVVVMDEAAQVLTHALFSTGTAIGTRRPEVLANLSQLLAGAAQVIAADAQLSDPVLAALEAATGARALLIGSQHQPAAGRELVTHPTRASWRRELVEQLGQHRRLWVFTTAQKAGHANSAQNLQTLARQRWPEARTLLVDSETVADPNHDAHRLAADPDGIASRYDVVLCTPAVAAGLSVTLQGHFAAVFVGSGGTTDPEAIAQAAARVRDDCPRHLYAPERSPGRALRHGSGCFEPQQLLNHQAQHGAAIAAQLAGTVDLATGSIGPWLPLWAELAASSNRKALAYLATVRGLLEREGYRVLEAAELGPDGEMQARVITRDLKQLAEASQAAEDAAVIAAEVLTDAHAAELLQRRRRLQPAERAQLERWRIGRAWGLEADAPTAELLEADREQRSQRGRFGWALLNLEARQLVAVHDHAAAQQLAPRGIAWAPDLCRELIGPKLTAAEALGLPALLRRSDWFTADDAQLQQLQATATAHAASLTQALGVSTGKTGTGTLRRLLKLTGHRLEAQRSREAGDRAWRYRVVLEAMPPGVSPQQLEAAWVAQLSRSPGGGVSQKIPYMNRGE